MYDYLIIGAGLFGSICAQHLAQRGKKVLVIDKRSHVGGNCFTKKLDNIHVHMYGPHIFHTSNEDVWKWLNSVTEMTPFKLQPVANFKGELFSLPFNMWTFYQMWGVSSPAAVKEIIKEQSSEYRFKSTNLEEQAIKTVGTDVYEKLIRGYTEKQWLKPATELPPAIIKRLPVRFNFDNDYFKDKYQGIPKGGYTQIFDKLLENVEVMLGTDFFSDTEKWKNIATNILYTGPIDRFYDYKFGHLEYKSLSFDHKKVYMENFQGTAMMTFTDIEIPYTRIVEHKHFEDLGSDVSWITYEYPVKYSAAPEPMYPVNDKVNNEKYAKYKSLAKKEHNIFFGGRLAEYKYYDMDKVIESALKFRETLE